MKPVLSHTVERFLKDRGKQKIVLFGISGVCLVALVAVIAVGATVHVNRRKEPGNTDSKGQELSASAKAIQSLCQYTDYNDVCEDSLMKSGANTTDPKELIKISFGTASQYISEAAKKSDTLKEIEQNNRTSAALDNCKEMLEYAINDLKTCSDKLDESKIMNDTNMVEDLRIWISAAITYQETCLDGFENTTGDAADTMEDALKTAGELTSNSLAMITEISSILSSFQNFGTSQRHLLQHQHVLGHDSHTDFMDYPPWISHGRRRLLKTNQINPQVTVAKDGSGDYISINDALKHVLRKSNDPYIIYIKKGIYKEQVIIEDTMTNVILIGDGPRRTRITGSLNFVDGVPTCQTATVIVIGDFFMAKGIAFENTAGTEKHQAVALRVQSDFSVFYNCHIDGYQDTLYVHTNRQFYRDCVISGTIDFIFGDAAAVLQNCRMFVRKPLDNQFCAVTAQGRKDKRQPTGILIQGGEIVGAPDYLPEIKTYLGRPWKAYSRTVIMETFLDSLIAPEGWTPWQGNLYIDSCFYAEFNNNGPGSSTDQRVKWPGIKTISPENLYKYTPGVFIGGNQWIPQKGVPYNNLENYCPKNVKTYNSIDQDGTKTYGGYSDIIVVDQHYVLKFPDNLPPDAGAPLLCAGITIYSPMKYYEMTESGKHLGVAGLGGLGHITVKLAKAFGLKVTVISSSSHKEAEAISRLGADLFLLTRDAEKMKAAQGSMDYIIDTVSAVHALDPLISLLKLNGKLVTVGLPEKPLELPIFPLVLGRKLVGGSDIGGIKETQEMLDFCAEHNILADIELIRMEDISTAMERLTKSDVKYRFVIDAVNSLP